MRISAAEAIRLLAAAGNSISRNRKNAPGYKWCFDYRLNGEDITLTRLRNEAERLPLSLNLRTGRYELRPPA